MCKNTPKWFCDTFTDWKFTKKSIKLFKNVKFLDIFEKIVKNNLFLTHFSTVKFVLYSIFTISIFHV